MTTIHSVGALYHPDRRRWPEGAEYNCRKGQHELRLCFARPSDVEVAAVGRGESEFGLLVQGEVFFFLYKFGSGADFPWSDAPFQLHLLPAAERVVPPVELPPEKCAALTVILIDAATGIIQALRYVALGHDFSVALHRAIAAQAAAPFDPRTLDAAIAAAYGRYEHSEEMAAQAIRTKGGA